MPQKTLQTNPPSILKGVDPASFLVPATKPAQPVLLPSAHAIERLTPRLALLRRQRDQLVNWGGDDSRLTEVNKEIADLERRIGRQGDLFLNSVNDKAPAGSVDPLLDTTRINLLRDEARGMDEHLGVLLGKYHAMADGDEFDAGMLAGLRELSALHEGKQRELKAEEKEFRTRVTVHHAANDLECRRAGVPLPPLLGRLAEVTSIPGFYVPRDGHETAPEAVPEGFDDSVSAWLARQQLFSGAQAVTLLGPSGIQALGNCVEPLHEPAGPDSGSGAPALVAAPATVPAAPSAHGALTTLAERVAPLPAIAGPVWVVTTAQGVPGDGSHTVAGKEDRSGGREFLPWSPQAAYGPAVARFSAQLDCAAAQEAFKDITSGLAVRAIGTVVGGKLTDRTIRSFFELLTGGVDRFTKSSISSMASLALDVTSIALGSGGSGSRLAGAVLDVVRDAPLSAMCDGLRDAGEQVSQAAARLQEKLGELFAHLPENLQDIPAKAAGFLDAAWAGAAALLGALKDRILRLWTKLQPLWDKISSVFKKIAPYVAKASEHMDTALQVFLENIADLWERIKHLPDLFKGLTGLLHSALEAAATSLPLMALKTVIKEANKWVAELGGTFFARLDGGPEAFDKAIGEFTGRLGKVQAATAAYALNRSVFEAGRPAVDQEITTREPLLAFRQQSDAFDHALRRARSEPGDRHVVLSRVDLDDGHGRDLGPLLACSPHHEGQDVLLLPGARLQVTGSTVLATPAGSVALNLLAEKTGRDTGLDLSQSTFGDIGWLKQAPATSHSTFRHLLDIGTRMHAVTQTSRFVMEYYGGDMERWVREVLGAVASEVWLAARDRYEPEHIPDEHDRLRGWIAEQGLTALGFGAPLARLAGDLGRGNDLADCLAQFRTMLEADREAGGRSAKTVVKAVAAAEKALDLYRKHAEAEELKEKADRAAQVIGAALGIVETILELGPQAVVDTMMSAEGFLGAGVRSAFGQRVMGGADGHTFVRNTDGRVAAALAAAGGGIAPMTHKVVKTGHEFFGKPLVNLALMAAPLGIAAVNRLGGGSGGTTIAAVSAALGAGQTVKWAFTNSAATSVASLPEGAVNDLSTVGAGLGGALGRFLADYWSGPGTGRKSS